MKLLLTVLSVILVIVLIAYQSLIFFMTRPAAQLQAGPTVSIAQGDIKSGIDRKDNNILLFNGLPYAAAPVGDLRWRPPAPAPGWDGLRDGRSFGPECLQRRTGSAEFYNDIVKGLGLSWPIQKLVAALYRNTPPPNESEDCLYLNVRTGNLANEELQPVMVWLHGGSHQTGSGSSDIYQDNGLVRNGIVLVTINYRLGPFGYMAHPALSADDPRGVSGNYGLLDQIAALEWVRDNIEAFGGDPSNVTVFGESAGAQSVSELMAAPASKGLFHKGILQSGASTYNANMLDAAIPERLSMHQAGVEFLHGLADADADAATLRSIPGPALVNQIANNPKYRDYLLPTADGVVIPEIIGAAIMQGNIGAIPILAGYNGDEGTLFYDEINAPTVLKVPFPDQHAARLQTLYDIYGVEDGDVLVAEYGLQAEQNYTAGAIDMLGDDLFGVHMRYLAKSLNELDQPSWLYQFNRLPLSEKQTLGAFHAAEISFVFDSHSPFLERTAADDELTIAMGRYWTNFAKTGNPNGAGLPDWPQYDPETDAWLTFNPEIIPANRVRATKLDIMERTLKQRIIEAVAAGRT